MEYKPSPTLGADSPMMIDIMQTVLGNCPNEELKYFKETEEIWKEVGLDRPGLRGWGNDHRCAAYILLLKSQRVL